MNIDGLWVGDTNFYENVTAYQYGEFGQGGRLRFSLKNTLTVTLPSQIKIVGSLSKSRTYGNSFFLSIGRDKYINHIIFQNLKVIHHNKCITTGNDFIQLFV
ncbi:hypothetical protein AMTRI_Chr12g268510 [Amborella trichopoda]